ncbi:MAG TPA: tetratricopeptide repeat protein [Tepidisphaeraceae bacterium]
MIQTGWDQYRAGEFRIAIEAFEAAAGASEGTAAHQQALYALATTWSLRRPGEDLPRAAQLFEQVIAESPQSDLAAWSMLALARMKHLAAPGQPIDRDVVSTAYQRVIDHFPNHVAAEEAFVYQQSIAVATLEPADARRALEKLQAFLRDHPGTSFASATWGLIAECHRTLIEPGQDLAARIKALETRQIDPLNPLADVSGTYWNIAVCAEYDVGDLATARKFYERFLKEYPNDQRSYGAQVAIARIDRMEHQ